ncbi:MAG: pseudouridine synthase, partial [Candidatus Babeliales bacterium]
MQLNKYLAHAGVCSRREAEKIIREGLITINHAEVSDPGYRVKETDVVRYKKKIVKPEEKIYLLLNKPVGVVTTTSDDKKRPTVMDLIDWRKISQRVYPVGRLDYDTSGVLLMTNDGELSQKLAHPRYQVAKTYVVTLDKPVNPEDLDKIRKGIVIDRAKIKVDALAYLNQRKQDLVKMTIHSGKYRVIRRIFERFGYYVDRLDRVKFAGLSTRGLGRGNWRELTKKEIEQLCR